MIAIGLALLAYGGFHSAVGRSWLYWVVVSGFLLAGITYAATTEAVELNRETQTWSDTRRIFSWRTHARQGSFDELAGVALSQFRRPVLTFPSRFWVVSVEFRDPARFYDLFWSADEMKAREKIAVIAPHLGLPTIDGSGRVP